MVDFTLYRMFTFGKFGIEAGDGMWYDDKKGGIVMEHPDRKKAKRYDSPGRCRAFTDTVYSGQSGSYSQLVHKIGQAQQAFEPPAPEYQVFFGELHGHTNLSDGIADPERYYPDLKEKAKLDFGALTDHDHGGIAGAELWGEKWEYIRSLAKRHYEPGVFTTILAYERDSYPWYNNMVVYYADHEGQMIRGNRDGELTRQELHTCLAREDLLLVPHDTNVLSPGTDFLSLAPEDMPPLIQVYSRDNCSERYYPEFFRNSDCEGGHWQDALMQGARMGCIAASDDHCGTCGMIVEDRPYPEKFPGITGVWAKENTLSGIFEALKARRCYGFMGGRITLDFRINGHYMGEEFACAEDLTVFWNIGADAPIDRVTLVKNCRDYITVQAKNRQVIFDYKPERPVDVYYLRVRLTDGRMAWSSPIWVTR